MPTNNMEHTEQVYFREKIVYHTKYVGYTHLYIECFSSCVVVVAIIQYGYTMVVSGLYVGGAGRALSLS